MGSADALDRAKYAGKTGLSTKELRRRFCDQGWRIADNGVVFTGASNVAVTRYRYRGTSYRPPGHRQHQADQRVRHAERPVGCELHAGCGKGACGKRPVATPVPCPQAYLTKARSWLSIAPTMTCSPVTTSWPLYPAT